MTRWSNGDPDAFPIDSLNGLRLGSDGSVRLADGTDREMTYTPLHLSILGRE